MGLSDGEDRGSRQDVLKQPLVESLLVKHCEGERYGDP